MEPVLRAVEVSKRFGGVTALDRVSLDLHAGEVHALVGENGAGKSTLIKLFTGVHAADEGEITYRGESVSMSVPRDAWEMGISTTFQEISLVPLMSVARNLYLGTEPRTRWRLLAVEEMNRDATALLRRYGIDIDVRRPVKSFGAGVQQMIAIVRAVSSEARVVILDEPTASLEPREVEQVFGMIRRLRTAGVALLFVSHNLDEVFRISDRITILRDGRRAQSKLLTDTTKLEVIATMLGRDVDEVRSTGRTSFTREQQVRDEVVLEAVGLSRRHRFRDVSLSVRAGEVLGLAGLLGSGRSETVRAIFGTQRIDKGSVQVSGRRLRTGSPQASLAAGAALLPEDRKAEGIVPTMSVRDNIVLMALSRVSRWGFLSPGRVDRLATEFIGRLGIRTSGGGQNIGQLSGGNQQKALLARMLCIEPKVLLLDEPTRGIDIGAKAEVQSIIQELADQGRGIVLISSELEDVVEGSNRVVVLKNGTVVGELGRDEVDEHRIMQLIAAAPSAEERPIDARAHDPATDEQSDS
jgi:ribose transport system ATP-binding protein